MWITWKHQNTDFPDELSFEQKVEVFYEQTLDWHLHIADLVANGATTFGEFKAGTLGYAVPAIRHSGFAVVQLCLSYLELVTLFLAAVDESALDKGVFRRIEPDEFEAHPRVSAVGIRKGGGDLSHGASVEVVSDLFPDRPLDVDPDSDLLG